MELIIPPNINDPLNLLSPVDKTEYELQLTCNANIMKKRQRKRYKSTSEFHPMNTRKKVAFATKLGTSPAKPSEGEAAYDSTVSKESSDDELRDPSWEIVDKNAQKDPTRISPTVNVRKPSSSGDDTKATTTTAADAEKEKEEVAKDGDPFDEANPPKEAPEAKPETSVVLQKNARCQYGNYNRYFGFESLNKNMDVRLKIFQRNVHLFKNKDVLDIGCNVGLMTLAIAKLLSPKSITGVDIDRKLINIARNKLKKYVAVPDSLLDTTETAKRHRTACFPMSFPICYGNLSASFKLLQKKVQTPLTLVSTPQTPQNEAQNPRIPENVSFEEVNESNVHVMMLTNFNSFTDELCA